MPMRSEQQRKFLWAKHPTLAREFEDATPKGTKLPGKVKHAFLDGRATAFERYGFKHAAQEVRLQIPRREFHGWDGAFRNEAQRNLKKADPNAESLTEHLQNLDAPNEEPQDHVRNLLDRDALWSTPSNPASGDAASRLDGAGAPSAVEAVF